MSEQVTTENLLDLAAFIRRSAEKGEMDKASILIHAMHDVQGFLTDDKDPSKLYWVPRTKGWAKERGSLVGQKA